MLTSRDFANLALRAAALQAFTEILIPTDDTPGAREALMPMEWRGAMDSLRQAGFHAADAEGRPRHQAYNAYLSIKQQNTLAFYTSRAGTIEGLHYKGNSYNAAFPACTHPEHKKV
jgi:hypothetical protein